MRRMRRRDLVTALIAFQAVGAQAQARARQIVVLHEEWTDAEVAETGSRSWQAFFSELRRRGYVEGSNLNVHRVSIHSHGPQRHSRRDVTAAALALNPEAIVVSSTFWAARLKALTDSVPIVVLGSDPLGQGLASTLARPGGNVTGVTTDTGEALLGKRLDYLLQASPRTSHVACLGYGGPGMRALWREAQRRHVGVQEIRVGSDPNDYVMIFESLKGQAVEAVLVLESSANRIQSELIAQLSLKHRLPIASPYRELPDAGGLMSYGVDMATLERRRASYVARILDGEYPGDLPIEQPTRFELVVNQRAAAKLGLELPPALLVQADEVIE
jgi:putative tryptophan/tyrosine transport system substrate-binding protein